MPRFPIKDNSPGNNPRPSQRPICLICQTAASAPKLVVPNQVTVFGFALPFITVDAQVMPQGAVICGRCMEHIRKIVMLSISSEQEGTRLAVIAPEQAQAETETLDVAAKGTLPPPTVSPEKPYDHDDTTGLQEPR